jgi:hypothetical protein
VDPLTHQVYNTAPTIPGSGILATTFPPRDSFYPAPESSLGNILVETPNGNINANAGGIVQLQLNNQKSSGSSIEVLAGYELRDSQGNPVSAANISSGKPVQVADGKNIDASGSGVIGNNVDLQASGNIKGVIFARGNASLSAQQNANVTVLAQGKVDANVGGTLSGTVIGVGGVSASGTVDATVLSQNANVNGSSSADTFAQGTAANTASQGMSAESASNKAAQNSATEADDLLKKEKKITLVQKTGRVTVILPSPKKVSETATKDPKI